MGGGPIEVAEGLGVGTVGTEYGAGPGRGMLSRGRLGSGEPLSENIRESTFSKLWSIRIASSGRCGEGSSCRRGLRRHPGRGMLAPAKIKGVLHTYIIC